MKLTSTLFITSISVLLLTLNTSFRPKPAGSLGTVYFGTAQDHGGACVGRGLCRKSSGGITTSSSNDGINVSFELLDGNPNVLVMKFSLAELQAIQPDQVGYFVNGGGSYMFDADCPLTGAIFDQLNLPANSSILTTSTSQIVIDGDVVTDYIVYSHD